MALRLKENLLLDILNPLEKTNKYSKSLLNIKTAIELEKEEDFEIPTAILSKFNLLEKRANNFLNGIPLKVVEKAYYLHAKNFKKSIFMSYKNNSLTMNINEIYIELEEYFNKIFILASLMANYYNLEIKIKTKTNNDYA